MPKIPNPAHLMAQKIQSMKPAAAVKLGIPSTYRKYQSHKIKTPIRLKGKPARSVAQKGLSNPYQEA
jgi:hypothetical protein